MMNSTHSTKSARRFALSGLFGLCLFSGCEAEPQVQVQVQEVKGIETQTPAQKTEAVTLEAALESSSRICDEARSVCLNSSAGYSNTCISLEGHCATAMPGDCGCDDKGSCGDCPFVSALEACYADFRACLHKASSPESRMSCVGELLDCAVAAIEEGKEGEGCPDGDCPKKDTEKKRKKKRGTCPGKDAEDKDKGCPDSSRDPDSGCDNGKCPDPSDGQGCPGCDKGKGCPDDDSEDKGCPGCEKDDRGGCEKDEERGGCEKGERGGCDRGKPGLWPKWPGCDRGQSPEWPKYPDSGEEDTGCDDGECPEPVEEDEGCPDCEDGVCPDGSDCGCGRGDEGCDEEKGKGLWPWPRN